MALSFMLKNPRKGRSRKRNPGLRACGPALRTAARKGASPRKVVAAARRAAASARACVSPLGFSVKRRKSKKTGKAVVPGWLKSVRKLAGPSKKRKRAAKPKGTRAALAQYQAFFKRRRAEGKTTAQANAAWKAAKGTPMASNPGKRRKKRRKVGARRRKVSARRRRSNPIIRLGGKKVKARAYKRKGKKRRGATRTAVIFHNPRRKRRKKMKGNPSMAKKARRGRRRRNPAILDAVKRAGTKDNLIKFAVGAGGAAASSVLANLIHAPLERILPFIDRSTYLGRVVNGVLKIAAGAATASFLPQKYQESFVIGAGIGAMSPVVDMVMLRVTGGMSGLGAYVSAAQLPTLGMGAYIPASRLPTLGMAGIGYSHIDRPFQAGVSF